MIVGHYNNKFSNAAFYKDPNLSHLCHRRIRPLPFLNRRCLPYKLAKLSRPSAPSVTTSENTPAVTPNPSHIKLALPKALQRPTLCEVNAQDIYNVCPELKDTTPAFVREKLPLLAADMLAGLQSAHITPPKAKLPKEIEVFMSDAISLPHVCPTHIVAIRSSDNNRSRSKFSLYPIHQLVFLANCSSMPALPSSPAATPAGNTSNKINLPVVALDVPSPETFATLLKYLYTKNTAALRSSLLPENWAVDLASIIRTAILVHRFWLNARAFGVVDLALFQVIEECWEIVMASLHQPLSSSSSSS